MAVAEFPPLADIVFQIEEQLDAAVFDELPFAVADGLLLTIGAIHAPIERALFVGRFTGQHG